MSFRATGWLGSRTATVSSPAVTASLISGRRGSTIVSGPGQKASISFSTVGVISLTIRPSSSL